MSQRISKRQRREGAAMLVVLMVLMMTTATATFAIHSTTMEIRSAGYGRQAMQTGYVAEGAAYAGLSYLDGIGPMAAFIQYTNTQVAAGTPYVPGAASLTDSTNLLRFRQEDFATRAEVSGDPLAAGTSPSLGAGTAFQPSFLIDLTDVYEAPVAQTSSQRPREQSGNDPMSYLFINATSRATIGLPGDVTLTGDSAAMNETVVHSRAMVEVGPFGGLSN